ncbi:response regulator transcription factor [bacterium]|jgi:DNA-binding CsgD family transcriptional regulator|nr:response regulator transcription factor [bacterium]
MLKNILKKISWLGITNKSLYEDSKRIEFSNQIYLFLTFVSFFYAAVFFWIQSYYLMALALSTQLLYISALILNSFGRFKWASFLVIANAATAIYLASSITGKDVSGQVLFVFLFPLTNMLFSKKDKLLKRICLTFPLIAFVLLEVTNYTFFYQAPLSPPVIKALSISVFIMTSSILYFMFQFYIHIFQHVKNSLNQIVSIYPLTEREVEIILEVLKGKNNKDAGLSLFIEESTVKNHLKSIFKKLNVKSRTELMAKCMN